MHGSWCDARFLNADASAKTDDLTRDVVAKARRKSLDRRGASLRSLRVSHRAFPPPAPSLEILLRKRS